MYAYTCDLPQDHCKQPPNNRSIPKVDPRPFKPSALVSSHPILCFPYIFCIQCDILVVSPSMAIRCLKSVCLQELGREQFEWHHTQLQLDTSDFVRAQHSHSQMHIQHKLSTISRLNRVILRDFDPVCMSLYR